MDDLVVSVVKVLCVRYPGTFKMLEHIGPPLPLVKKLIEEGYAVPTHWRLFHMEEQALAESVAQDVGGEVCVLDIQRPRSVKAVQALKHGTDEYSPSMLRLVGWPEALKQRHSER